MELIAENRIHALTALVRRTHLTHSCSSWLAQAERVEVATCLATDILRVTQHRSAHLEQQRTVAQLDVAIGGGLVAADDQVAVDLAEAIRAERATVLIDDRVTTRAVEAARVGGELLGDDRERSLAGARTNVHVPDSHVTLRVAGDEYAVLHDRVTVRVERASVTKPELPRLHAGFGVGQDGTELDLHDVLAAVLVVDQQTRGAAVKRQCRCAGGLRGGGGVSGGSRGSGSGGDSDGCGGGHDGLSALARRVVNGSVPGASRE